MKRQSSTMNIVDDDRNNNAHREDLKAAIPELLRTNSTSKLYKALLPRNKQTFLNLTSRVYDSDSSIYSNQMGDPKFHIEAMRLKQKILREYGLDKKQSSVYTDAFRASNSH